MTTEHLTPCRRTEFAFATIEAMVGIALLAMGLLAFASATATGTAAAQANRENAAATRIARAAMERVRSSAIEFKSLLSGYTTGIVDPETKVRTAPLPRTTKETGVGVEGATVTIVFPVVENFDDEDNPVVLLREDLAQLDLNGDGVIDTESHTDDYKLLPVLVSVQWSGRNGVRKIELSTVLAGG